MPNWGEILKEINETPPNNNSSPLDIVRRKYLQKLHRYTKRNVIAYYSGFLSKPNDASVAINDDDKNGFMLCIHGLKKDRGLDLILHTPGGSIATTESLVFYLKEMFGNDIRAIIPQTAMSAGTMIACCCKSIVMGKHSNLGPCDPQIDGFPAIAVRRQFDDMYNEILADQRAADVWAPIIRQLGPSFLKECDWAKEWAEEFVRGGLIQNMFAGEKDAEAKADHVQQELTAAEKNKGHDRHIHYDACKAMGLKIEQLEDDNKLQDIVLTVHHCFMHTLSNSAAVKIIENHKGQALIKNTAMGMQFPLLQFGSPPPFSGTLGNP
jgi:hypothetical protein